MRHIRQALGVVLEQVQELLVPRGVVEARALAVDLVRQAARGDDADLERLGVALDGAAQRLAQPVAAPRRGNGELQHAHLQRHQAHGPAGGRVAGAQHGQGREAAVVQRPVLEERHVELIRHQAAPQVCGEFRVALHAGQVARARAFVGHGPVRAHAQREGRVVVEEERGDVVVVDEQQHVGLALVHPTAHGVEGFEDGRPHRVAALVAVVGEADGGRVRGGDAADDGGHEGMKVRGWRRAWP